MLLPEEAHPSLGGQGFYRESATRANITCVTELLLKHQDGKQVININHTAHKNYLDKLA